MFSQSLHLWSLGLTSACRAAPRALNSVLRAPHSVWKPAAPTAAGMLQGWGLLPKTWVAAPLTLSSLGFRAGVSPTFSTSSAPILSHTVSRSVLSDFRLSPCRGLWKSPGCRFSFPACICLVLLLSRSGGPDKLPCRLATPSPRTMHRHWSGCGSIHRAPSLLASTHTLPLNLYPSLPAGHSPCTFHFLCLVCLSWVPHLLMTM